jgi:hypothetical protein
VNVGKAAHITAASPGGARYDATLTREQRRDQSNGIWMCAIHADQIDRDEEHFTVELLRKWKKDAEERAFRELSTGRRSPAVASDELDLNAINALGLPATDDISSVADRLKSAAQADLEAFMRLPGWPPHAIPLALGVKDTDGRLSVDLATLVKALEQWDQLTIVAPPGTGKSTTLLLLAKRLLASGNTVPIIIPLSEWALQTDRLLQSLPHRAAFRGFREEHFMLLAHHGKLTLLLDGWNEVGSDCRLRCITALKELRRDFPLLGIAITTRRQALDVPIVGRIIELDPLSEDQQLALATALRGEDGEQLLDMAWRTPGVRDLMSIPLYLTALFSESPGSRIPTTKEEVLRLFVEQHERVPEKAEAFRTSLQDSHHDYLGALAAEGTRSANVAITEARSREVIKSVEDKLVTLGQIATPPQPNVVLDVLVSHHTLVRASGVEPTISFQHQQFQEWFASFEAERLMLASATGDEAASAQLQSEVLNLPSWEEAILFACERMARRDDLGWNAVARAIIQTLTIDPMLAAEMIFRSTEQVWMRVKDTAVEFATRWHQAGRVDRAARFMITTGRPEFAEPIWALINNPDDQVHLRAMRTARRFRPSVLGPDAADRLAAMPEKLRGDIASEIILNGSTDGIEFVGNFARTETNPVVLAEIIEALHFRRADRWVRELLASAPDDAWSLLARRSYGAELAGDEAAARLVSERIKELHVNPDPLREIRLLVHGELGETSDAVIAKKIAAPTFDPRAEHAASTIYRAFEGRPDAVVAGLLARLEAGLQLPYGCADLLENAALIDEGPLPDAVLSEDSPKEVAKAASKLIGPVTIGRLIDKLIAAHEALDRSSRQSYDEYHHVKDLIQGTLPQPFVEALLQSAATNEPQKIALFADLLAGHGKEYERGPLDVSDERLAALVLVVNRWGESLLADQSTARHQMAEVARAIERLAHPDLVEILTRLLKEDLSRWDIAKRELREALSKGSGGSSDARHSYVLQYGRAFAAIGNSIVVEAMQGLLRDPEFGVQAAVVLNQIWHKERGDEKPKGFGATWPDYSVVETRRAGRQRAEIESSALAESIFVVVEELAKRSDEAGHRRALELASIAFSMSYKDKDELIATLLDLPLSLVSKRHLLLTLVSAGEVLSADLLLKGLRAFLVEAKTKAWLLDDRSDLSEWLELLAFSDRPLVLLDGIDLLDDAHRGLWRFRRLISALAYAPEKAEHLLLGLVAKDARFFTEYEWTQAFLRKGSESAVRALLDCIQDGTLTHHRGGIDRWHLSQQLAKLALENAAVRTELETRYSQGSRGRALGVLESALIEIADRSIIMLLVRSYTAAGRRFDGDLRRAVEHVVTGRQTVEGWQGAYEIVPTPATELRKDLFGLLSGTANEAALARDCLTCIDKLRDEHGRPDLEPRHPDIGSGQPWPLVNADTTQLTENAYDS